ncbi:hypothetical protein [Paraburkholderia youngii]|uniref:hypothetical protein n=1 Tax=Paraburkholderia youngii TaxID=2782701 RepID=UPI003D1D5064
MGYRIGMLMARRALHRCNTLGGYMLELIEIVRGGLPLGELRTWVFFATAAATGIAGWYSYDVLVWYTNRKKDAR